MEETHTRSLSAVFGWCSGQNRGAQTARLDGSWMPDSSSILTGPRRHPSCFFTSKILVMHSTQRERERERDPLWAIQESQDSPLWPSNFDLYNVQTGHQKVTMTTPPLTFPAFPPRAGSTTTSIALAPSPRRDSGGEIEGGRGGSSGGPRPMTSPGPAASYPFSPLQCPTGRWPSGRVVQARKAGNAGQYECQSGTKQDLPFHPHPHHHHHHQSRLWCRGGPVAARLRQTSFRLCYSLLHEIRSLPDCLSVSRPKAPWPGRLIDD